MSKPATETISVVVVVASRDRLPRNRKPAMLPSPQRDPIVVKFYRRRAAPLLVANLKLCEIAELCGWADRGIDFLVIHHEMREDVTRVVLA